MNDQADDCDRADEDILTFTLPDTCTLPDDALEAAAGMKGIISLSTLLQGPGGICC